MTLEERKKLFCESWKQFKQNLKLLKTSIERIKNLDKLDEIQRGEAIEAFLSRYSRTVDLLINKVLRGLDILEMEDTSKKLDIVIRAEKRGFIKDFNVLIEMKDLRNELAHEYVQKRIEEALQYSLEIFIIAEKIENYLKENRYC